MSGGGGGGVIIKSVINTLNDPMVHGNLPDDMRDKVDDVLKRDPSSWTDEDKTFLGSVYAWGMINLP